MDRSGPAELHWDQSFWIQNMEPRSAGGSRSFAGTQLLGANGGLVTVINDERDVATVAAHLNGATCKRACTSLLLSFCLIPQVNAATYLQACTLNGFTLLSRAPSLFSFFFCSNEAPNSERGGVTAAEPRQARSATCSSRGR